MNNSKDNKTTSCENFIKCENCKLNVNNDNDCFNECLSKKYEFLKTKNEISFNGFIFETKESISLLKVIYETCVKENVNFEDVINKLQEENQESKLFSLIKITINELKENKKRKNKKQSKNKLNIVKFNQNTSCFTSKLSSEITKKYNSKNLNNTTKSIISEEKNNDIGSLTLKQTLKETDTSYILENYRTIQFSREEIQIYLALLNVYMQNIKKKDYGIPFELSTKDLHNNILGKKNRLRKENLQKYENILQLIRSKTIIYNPENANIKPFNKKEFKDIRINSNLINVDIVNYSDYKEQIIRIVPSALTMLELKQIKQISNFLPIEIIRLGFDKSDNILYFALYLTNLHRNNESHIEKIKGKRPKRIYNKTFAKEINIKTIIEKALPNHKELLKTFNETSRKKELFDRNILEPLKETIEIYVNHEYINKNYIVPKYNKDIFKEKIKVIFIYDIGKLIETNKFIKDEKK